MPVPSVHVQLYEHTSIFRQGLQSESLFFLIVGNHITFLRYTAYITQHSGEMYRGITDYIILPGPADQKRKKIINTIYLKKCFNLIN